LLYRWELNNKLISWSTFFKSRGSNSYF